MRDMRMKTLRAYVKAQELIEAGDCILAGVSGGADSMALLQFLLLLSAEWELQIDVCHVHHGIRGQEAEEDASFVESFCRERGLAFHLYREDIPTYAKDKKLSLEEAGRSRRYEIFHELARELEEKRGRRLKIATAHHKNDSAETLLFNLCRGSGLAGLAGIRPQRGMIIRPLLCFNRREIEEFLQEEGLSYRTDSSNLEERYARNVLRRKVLPVLEGLHVGAVENMVQAANLLREADTYIGKQAKAAAKICFIWEKGELRALDIPALLAQEALIRQYVLRMFLKEAGGLVRDISRVHIADIEALLEMETGKSLSLPKGLRLYKSYDRLCFARQGEEKEEPKRDFAACFSCRIFPNKNFQICDLDGTKYIDYDKIKGTLSFRTRQSGDYIRIKNGRKSIKAFMTDAKIPAREREKILLVAAGSEVIWIVGKRLSEAYRIDEHTKTIMEIKYRGETKDVI